jgi:hypothetical protein
MPRKMSTASTRAIKLMPARTGFDEAFEPGGAVRSHYRPLVSMLQACAPPDIDRRERLQKLSLMSLGITFTVYGESEGIERVWPFDLVPRVIAAAEWQRLEAGLVQRVTALNLFLLDVYSEQRCLKDRIVPPELVFSRREYKRELIGIVPPRKVFTQRDLLGVVGAIEHTLSRDEGYGFLKLGESLERVYRTALRSIFPCTRRSPTVPSSGCRRRPRRLSRSSSEPVGRQARSGTWVGAGSDSTTASIAATDASARPSAIPPRESDGQCARSMTRATATSAIATTAATRTTRQASGDNEPAR